MVSATKNKRKGSDSEMEVENHLTSFPRAAQILGGTGARGDRAPWTSAGSWPQPLQFPLRLSEILVESWKAEKTRLERNLEQARSSLWLLWAKQG